VPDWLNQAITTLFLGGVAYGAIRADLKGLGERIARVEAEAASAREQIYKMLMK
jgi:hypothetical protein